jgi:glycosyltransferase involved in cell wall biosynthesis
VDGSSQDYGRGEKADAKQKLVNRFADVTIFQSDYCRYSTRERFPVIGGDGPVIHNPVDLDLFTPEGPAHDLPGSTPRLAFVTFSTNPMKGWPAVYDFARQYPELTFILVGRYDDPPDLPNIHVFGKVAHEDLPALLRGCDAFLAFQRNEACPNVVLEAMACGLPLLYVASGAIPELVGECGYPVDSETFRDQLQRLMENQNALATCARAHAESAFNAERLFARYREEIESAAAHRDPRRLRHWAWAWAVWLGRPIRNRLRGKNSPKPAADDRQE